MTKINRYATLVLIVLSLASCSIKRPKDVMEDDQMREVLYDFHIAKAMGDELPYEQSYKRQLYIEDVYRKHGITEAIFDSSMMWYARNTESLVKIYEDVNKRLKAERDGLNHLIALRSNRPQESVSGDSIDLWVWSRNQHLSGMPLDNRIQFEVNTDTTYYDRDRLVWQARFRFPEGRPNRRQAPVMALQMEFKNDSILSMNRSIVAEGPQELRIGADTLGQIQEIRGFIYYPRQDKARTVVVDQIRLMRYHNK